jgi:hypothetical protein
MAQYDDVTNHIGVAGCLGLAPERKATVEKDYSSADNEDGRSALKRDLEPP